MTAPPIAYFGSKQRIAERIAAMLPAHAEELAGWHRTTFRATTEGVGNARAVRTEVIWSNRLLGNPLLWDEATA